MFKQDRPIYVVGRSEIVKIDDIYANNYSYQVSEERNNFSDDQLKEICNKLCATPCYFIFTDNRLSFKMPQHILDRTICLNKKSTIISLTHKLVFREIFSKVVDMLPYRYVPADIIRDKSAIDILFGQENEDYVIQNFINNGGAGTYLLSEVLDGAERTKINCTMVATPFKKYAKTFRVVAAIPSVGTPILFPAMVERHTHFGVFSVDYDEFNSLSETIRNKTIDISDKIAQKIQEIGFRGILDFELLFVDDKLYLQEINPRQSCIIQVPQDLTMREIGLPSYMSILIDCFYNEKGIQGVASNLFDVIRPHNLVESLLRPDLANEFLNSEFCPKPIISGPDFHLFNVSINNCVDNWAKATNRLKMFNMKD